VAKLNSSGPEFRQMAIDDYTTGNYLLVYGYSIATTKDFRTIVVLSGNESIPGYQEGWGYSARFGYVNGIVTSPVSNAQIWLSDQDNSCIRVLSRETNRTRELTGECNQAVVKDGEFEYAGTAFPVGLAVSSSDKQKIYFYENDDGTVRCLLRIGSAWYIRTIYYLGEKIYALNFDPVSTYLYFSTNSSILRASTTWKSPSQIIISGYGHNDGILSSARVREPRSIFFLDSNTFLFADYKNHLLRLVNIINSTISSLCIKQTTNAQLVGHLIRYCKLQFPIQIVKSRYSSKIYLLQEFATAEILYNGEWL